MGYRQCLSDSSTVTCKTIKAVFRRSLLRVDSSNSLFCIRPLRLSTICFSAFLLFDLRIRSLSYSTIYIRPFDFWSLSWDNFFQIPNPYFSYVYKFRTRKSSRISRNIFLFTHSSHFPNLQLDLVEYKLCWADGHIMGCDF